MPDLAKRVDALFPSLVAALEDLVRIPSVSSLVAHAGDVRRSAEKVADLLRPHYQLEFDATQSIGRRYRRQDEIGTPYAITFDFDSLDDRAVTVRDRDTMEQDRIPIERLVQYLGERLP